MEMGDGFARFLERMSGRLTPPVVTPIDAIQRLLLPVADLFMVVMFSRPPGGSLRTAKVTWVTIGLGTAVALLAGIPGLVLLPGAVARHQLLLVLVGVLGITLGFGAADLTVFGVRQRFLMAAWERSRDLGLSPPSSQRGGGH
jgi:hypothetical protein